MSAQAKMAGGQMRLRPIEVQGGLIGMKRMGYKTYMFNMYVKYKARNPNLRISRLEADQLFVDHARQLRLEWIEPIEGEHDEEWMKEKDTEMLGIIMQKDTLEGLKEMWMELEEKFPGIDTLKPKMSDLPLRRHHPDTVVAAEHFDDPFLTPLLAGNFEVSTDGNGVDEGSLSDLDDDEDIKECRRTDDEVDMVLLIQDTIAGRPNKLDDEFRENLAASMSAKEGPDPMDLAAEEKGDDDYFVLLKERLDDLEEQRRIERKLFEFYPQPESDPEPKPDAQHKKKNKNKHAREGDLEKGVANMSLKSSRKTRKAKKQKSKHIIETDTADQMDLDG